MAEPITIDIFLKAKNQTREGVKEAAKDLETVENAAKGTAQAVEKVENSSKEAANALGAVEKASKRAKGGLEAVEKSGNKAKTGLDRVETSARKSKRGLDGVEKSSRQTRRTLRELARERIMILMEAKDRLTPVLERAGIGLRGLTRKIWSVPLKVLDYATRPVRGLLNMLTSIQGMMFGTAGALAGLAAPMNIAGDYEQTEMAFTTMLKDEDKAKSFLKEASDFANRTPFEFPELIDSSKLLLAFGFQAENVMGMIGTLGDTASGLGAGAEG